jgi:hypothetical protein
MDSAGRDSHVPIAYYAPGALLVGCYAVSKPKRNDVVSIHLGYHEMGTAEAGHDGILQTA